MSDSFFSFPLADIDLPSGRKIPVERALWVLEKHLTKERIHRIRAVVAQRNFRNSVVLENIYDRGNTSAVMRSAEAFGLSLVHLIEPEGKKKESARITAGADKWLEIRRWKSSLDCIQFLKEKQIKIYATHLGENSRSVADIDWSQNSAVVLGNEKEGVSAELRSYCDAEVVIPMRGFVQSFNISVAGALIFSEINRSPRVTLSQAQQQRLCLEYQLRTLDSAYEILESVSETGDVGSGDRIF